MQFVNAKHLEDSLWLKALSGLQNADMAVRILSEYNRHKKDERYYTYLKILYSAYPQLFSEGIKMSEMAVQQSVIELLTDIGLIDEVKLKFMQLGKAYTVRNMQKNGMSVKNIARFTDMSVKEIEALITGG